MKQIVRHLLIEIAAPEMTFRLEVADHRLDGRAASQFAFDDAEDGGPESPGDFALRNDPGH